MNLDSIDVLQIITKILIIFLVLPIHECAHAWAAHKMGDETAAYSGRLTLNPLAHIDILGALCLLITGFGWAKPVPVDLRYFKKPKQGMALTALAGPVSNFVLAFLALLACKAILYVPYSDGWGLAFSFCYYTAILSIGLGVFNLIPIPPLDGSKVLAVLLPDRFYGTWMHYERYGMVVLLALSFAGIGTGVIDAAINGVYYAMSMLLGMPF